MPSCSDATFGNPRQRHIDGILRSTIVNIEAGQCWGLAIDDKVQGTAILYAYNTEGCTECGAAIVGASNCPGVGLAIGSDAADRIYRRIVKSAPANVGRIEQFVFVSGEVVPNGSSGRPMLRAIELRAVKAKPDRS